MFKFKSNNLKIIFILLTWFIFSYDSYSQLSSSAIQSSQFLRYPDPCGYDPEKSLEMLQLLGPGWGYNYDSLLVDLVRWGSSPFIKIDSAGASIRNRALWLLTITDTTTINEPRFRISIHARTHPNEVQSSWVTNEIIKILIADSSLSNKLRQNCIFNVIPMYNPDGVELGYGRQNANGIDLESNWGTPYMEPETETMQRLFLEFMESDSPIRVALNMHSAYACKRYFVYHHENGTSIEFAEDERFFIGSIQKYWPDGIENWDYYVSWTTGTPTYYPESWFWLNHGETVMALTYEDMNCEDAGDFDRTAHAILSGIADYLGFGENTKVKYITSNQNPPDDFAMINVYPNPVSNRATANIQLTLNQESHLDFSLFDILGREVKQITSGIYGIGRYDFQSSLSNLSSGIYYFRLNSDLGHKTIPITVVD